MSVIFYTELNINGSFRWIPTFLPMQYIYSEKDFAGGNIAKPLARKRWWLLIFGTGIYSYFFPYYEIR